MLKPTLRQPFQAVPIPDLSVYPRRTPSKEPNGGDRAAKRGGA